MPFVPAICPQHAADDIARHLLARAVHMAVNIRRSRHIAVLEPFLDQLVLLQKLSELLGGEVGIAELSKGAIWFMKFHNFGKLIAIFRKKVA